MGCEMCSGMGSRMVSGMGSGMDSGVSSIWDGSSWHCGLEQIRIETKVLGHSLVRSLVRSHRSLVRSHRSLVRLLRTTRFARALGCAHSFAHSLTSLTPLLVGK